MCDAKKKKKLMILQLIEQPSMSAGREEAVTWLVEPLSWPFSTIHSSCRDNTMKGGILVATSTAVSTCQRVNELTIAIDCQLFDSWQNVSATFAFVPSYQKRQFSGICWSDLVRPDLSVGRVGRWTQVQRNEFWLTKFLCSAVFGSFGCTIRWTQVQRKFLRVYLESLIRKSTDLITYATLPRSYCESTGWMSCFTSSAEQKIPLTIFLYRWSQEC
jgi:hypothetical protein